ncbi:MAG TPA: four helix bundle protein [Opitutaceae bacterium]|nr:four helix bundle protein [Opitutaceae bacterium]
MSGAINHFSDLIVYQKAFTLGLRIFELSRDWPPEERYALTDQIRRSSRSVGANIAEAWSKRRYEAHFISKLSDTDAELHETEHWLRCAQKHGYISCDDLSSLSAQLIEVGKMLGGTMREPNSFLLKTISRRSAI